MGDGKIRAGGEAGVNLGEPPSRGDAAREAGRGQGLPQPANGARPGDATGRGNGGRGAGQSNGQTKDARQQEVEQSGKIRGHEISVRFRESAGPKPKVKDSARPDRPDSRPDRGPEHKAERAEAKTEARAERAEEKSERRSDRAESRSEDKSERRAERADSKSESRSESRTEKGESRSESRRDRAEADDDGPQFKSERREARAEGRDEGRTEGRTDAGRDAPDSKSKGRAQDRGERPEDFESRAETRNDRSGPKSEKSETRDSGRETKSESPSLKRDDDRREAREDRREARSESRTEARDDRRDARAESRAEKQEARAERLESRDDRRDARAESRTHHRTERDDDDRDRGPKSDKKSEPKFDSKSGPKFEGGDGRRADADGRDRPGRHAPDSPGHAYGHERRGAEAPPRDDGRSRAHDHGRGHRAVDLPDVGHDARSISAAVRDYLRGASKGADLPPDVRKALDAASTLLAEDFRQSLNFGRGHGDDKVLKIIDRALADVARTLEKSFDKGGRFARAPEQTAQAAVEELLQAALLNRYFKQLEKTGGRPVQQAEELVARLLYGGARAADGDAAREPRLSPAELLRDLRSGAFFPAQEARSPFPLTGRARVVTEMMELMRTLDAWERLMQRAEALRGSARAAAAAAAGEAAAVPSKNSDAALAAFLKSYLGGGAGPEALDEFLAALFPTLPGRAGRVEVVRLVAMLEGALADAQGRVLVARDGTPLKLDQLLWLGTAGGLLGSAFESETQPVRLSPLLIYGFDAVYSAIGFDGRTLAPPHFTAVQAQVNGSEPEWVFGQPPLTEGWMRALIERLKDAALPDHNLLGEMLEEALSEGRFHTVLVSGAVEEGSPVPDSFAVEKLLPGWSVGAAFA